jgi:hypothetical protein
VTPSRVFVIVDDDGDDEHGLIVARPQYDDVSSVFTSAMTCSVRPPQCALQIDNCTCMCLYVPTMDAWEAVVVAVAFVSCVVVVD